MTITSSRNTNEDIFCWRCQDLGISSPTILIGHEFMFLMHGDTVAKCCMDCFKRLQEEC